MQRGLSFPCVAASILRNLTSPCPYCGVSLTLEIDLSEGLPQDFTYDCQVCCRPIEVAVRAGGGGEPRLTLRTDDDIG